MKKLLLVTAITALTMTSIVSPPKAQAADIARSICEYIAADDKRRMRSFLKAKRLRIRNIFSDIKCNGQNLLEFAATNRSVETGSLMIGKLPKSIVSENLPLIQHGSQPLIDAANERVGS